MFDNIHWPESTRKRGREEEEINGILGFTEHRNKRLHSLPLRSSPNHKRWSGPPSFPVSQMPPSIYSPTDLETEDYQQLPSHFSPWSSSPALSQRSPNPPSMDADCDLDMATEPTDSLNPGPFQPDSIGTSISGRIPTPIHASFAAQVRGTSWAVSSNQAMQAVHHSIDSLPNDCGAAGVCVVSGYAHSQSLTPPARDASVPRSLEGGSCPWSMVQNRRLPSPISESGGEETPGSPGMVLDGSPTASHRPYLPHLPNATNPAMAHPNLEIVSRFEPDSDVGMMDTDSDAQEPHSPSSAPATPSPRSKFGHSRSKHTLNSWTLQPGMKKSFSIGYRADCEKCRLKIPGHFNHIIIS
ncbi:hypothetical protein BX600DRAFT_108850 [Xylariales sp. PMI_506]|nr:hypothetical protein BX600DRAFT_108850 [Xylariales sp. PMI_506]